MRRKYFFSSIVFSFLDNSFICLISSQSLSSDITYFKTKSCFDKKYTQLSAINLNFNNIFFLLLIKRENYCYINWDKTQY